MKRIPLLFIAAMAVPTTLHAWDFSDTEKSLRGVIVNMGVGATSGINASVGYRPFYDNKNNVLNTLAIRIDFNYLNSLKIPQSAINDIIHKKTDTSLDFSQGDAHFSHHSYGAVIDVYPFERVFRITGGIYKNHSEMHGDVGIGGTVTIGDNTYVVPPGFSMVGNVGFSKNFAPYLGIGVDMNVWRSLYITTDLGFLVNSYPSVSLALYGPHAFYIDPADMQKESDWIASKVSKLRAIPMLKIGLSYRF